MKTIPRLFVISMMLILTISHAQADEFGVFIISHHIKQPTNDCVSFEKIYDTYYFRDCKDTSLNQHNPGAYYRTHGYTVGIYENSFRNNVVFASRTLSHTLARDGKNKIVIRLDIGAVYGYGWHDGYFESSKLYGKRLLPFASPSLEINIHSYALNLHVLPGVVGLSMSFHMPSGQ